MKQRDVVQFAAELARDMGLSAAIRELDATSITTLYTPRGPLPTARVLAALRRWQPRRRSIQHPIWVYFGASRPVAERLLRDGVTSITKPVTLARARYKAREYATFAPGAGVHPGLYVSGTHRTASDYGPVVLRIRASRSALRIPPELRGFARTVDEALASHDGAVLLGTVHPSDIYPHYPDLKRVR